MTDARLTRIPKLMQIQPQLIWIKSMFFSGAYQCNVTVHHPASKSKKREQILSIFLETFYIYKCVPISYYLFFLYITKKLITFYNVSFEWCFNTVTEHAFGIFC